MASRVKFFLLLSLCLEASSLWPSAEAERLDQNYYVGGLHTPCLYFQTVNVTADQRFPNGSVLHEGVLIPHRYVGVYNYIYHDALNAVRVKPHLRGCICKIKPCINLCCPVGQTYSGTDCRDIGEEYEFPYAINMTRTDGTIKSVNATQQYAVVNSRPCDNMYALNPAREPEDAWQIFKNGTIYIEYDNIFVQSTEYCFVVSSANDSNTTLELNPAFCNNGDSYATMKIINAYAMLFSIPFMLLTVMVYLFLPELRNQHGKSLVCYLIGLIVGYTMLCINAFQIEETGSGLNCKALGYVAYYSFMAAFFWLNVISFDLWHNFRGTKGINRFNERKRFLLYSLYSCGVPLVFLAATMYMQEFVDVPYEWKPAIGGGEYCWINMTTWAGLIYFFIPVLCIILANIVMFIMTAMKIHKVQREMSRIMAREDSTRNLRNEKDKFGLFLRLFLVMGVTWSLEIISYFVGSNNAWSKVLYVADIGNALQGFLIFMLFVMKRKVKQLLTNRLFKRPAATPTAHTTSSSTNSINSLATQKSIVNPMPMAIYDPKKF